ncbi:MAG: ChaN family lipoprotein [Rhodospirillaceae bacterium]|nr:ChaN family lipoprotein [Rhodospirillaceae bacterium]
MTPNIRRTLCLLLISTALAACGARAPGPEATASPTMTKSFDLVDLTEFRLFFTGGGTAAPRHMSVAEAADVLKDYDVIFIGEAHRHPGNHIAQMALFRAIQERAPNVSLSLEQFERDVQHVVDDFMAGKIGEEPFRKASRAWDNYPGSYRPLVEYAKERGLPVIAAEAPTMVVRCVGQQGPEFLDKMKPENRGWAAAKLHLQDGPYKDKYMRFLIGDSGHGENAAKDNAPSAAQLRSFAAQVTRDDTMAESIYRHLQKNPGRKVVHLNGSFHSESFLGTAERLQLRDPKLKIAVVNPIQIKPGAKAEVSAADAKTGTFVLLIREAPKGYVSAEEERAAVMEQMKFRGASKCEL